MTHHLCTAFRRTLTSVGALVSLALAPQVTFAQGKNWLLTVAVLVIVAGPALLYFGGAIEGGPDVFMGGKSWQSLVYSIWEQLVGFGMIIGLIGLFKTKFPSQGSFRA